MRSREPRDWPRTLTAARTAGRGAARDAAGWWAQDTIGGRASGDVAAVARRVLTGIDDGDPAILDALPACPLPPDPGSEPQFYADLASDAPPWNALTATQRQQVSDAYHDGYTESITGQIAAECAAVNVDAEPRHHRATGP
ncbi:MAG: hypothetical protein ACRDT6_18465 [Micromonosporaceae bacterium]